MKRMLCIFLVSLICFYAVSSAASDTNMKTEAAEKLGRKIDAIAPTGIAGLYEVTSEGKILYVDKDLKFAISGKIFDLEKKVDVTQARLTEIQKIDFGSLPIADSIHSERGSAQQEIAIFSDPNCPYCKKLEQTLKTIKNIKIYTFLYPVLSEESARLSRDIWCSKSPSAKWNDWMLSKVAPGTAECEAPNERNLLLGKRLNINATPVIFFSDGSRIIGNVDATKIVAKLTRLNAVRSVAVVNEVKQ